MYQATNAMSHKVTYNNHSFSLPLHQLPKHKYHTTTTMPSDDYTSAVRGGLKLKGASSAKPSGIKKKKKKTAASTSDSKAESIEKALVDEDAKQKNDGEGERDPDELSEEQLRELEQRGGDGKTASERAYEDMRRKRVRLIALPIHIFLLSEFARWICFPHFRCCRLTVCDSYRIALQRRVSRRISNE